MGVNGFFIGKAMQRDEFRLYVGGFVMPRTRATIREGWDCVAEWRREGDDDGKGTIRQGQCEPRRGRFQWEL